MNINESISAIHSINASFNMIPSRMFNAFHNTEAKEGVENVLTDMMVDQHAFTANVKALRTMITVEDILLNELRKEG